MSVTILVGDVLEKLATLKDESVHCVVTSPPYWGLRDYGVEGQIGLEPTVEEYVEKMVAVFREVRRVLRKDGTLWLNMGDCYASNPASGGPQSEKLKGPQNATPNRKEYRRPGNLKPKDLVGQPWRLAFALQADGWYLRSDIIWAKPNPMPESCRDRPTKAHEYIFMFSRSPRYFWDQEAVREKSTGQAGTAADFARATKEAAVPGQAYKSHRTDRKSTTDTGTRNMRSVWPAPTTQLAFISWLTARVRDLAPDALADIRAELEYNDDDMSTIWRIATQPFPQAHFATFPEELPRRCIAAGTSEKGCCPKCGAPWVRVVEARQEVLQASNNRANEVTGWAESGNPRTRKHTKTTGWKAGCRHKGKPIPCTVLDPFSGAGTTGLVAVKMGRNYIGIELNPEYAKMAEDRIYNAVPLLIGD